MVPDPLPLAYAVYAFINVDNCERPLNGSFNSDDSNTRKCNVPVAYYDGITQLMVLHGTESDQIYVSVAELYYNGKEILKTSGVMKLVKKPGADPERVV